MTKKINRPPKKCGRPLGSVPPNKLQSELPELAGKRFGKLTVVTGEVIRRAVKERQIAYILVECDCGKRSEKDYTSVVTLKAGCRACGSLSGVPDWLLRRCSAVKDRCTNKKHTAYNRYGGRGIEFRFETSLAMAKWVMSALGVNKDLTLDRINNDGHYEPGNLRLAGASLQANNQRKRRVTAEAHAFLIAHPNVKYAPNYLKKLIATGMTWKEICDRHDGKNGGKGPVGPYLGRQEYSTSLTPDQDIASLSKDF